MNFIFLALGNSLANNYQHENYEYSHVTSVIHLNTDIDRIRVTSERNSYK